MEKSFEMDFGEWEILPDPRPHHAFVDLGLGGEKGLLFTKDFDADYFSAEEKSSGLMIEGKDQDHPILSLSLERKDIGVLPPPPLPPPQQHIPMIVADSHDVASVVLFKKLKDDELFVNTRIESPKISAQGTIMPPVEPEQMLFDSEEEEEEEEFYKDEKNSEKEMELEEPAEVKEKQFGIKIWRWRVMGSVGALCSIGVAAATLCIFILGGHQMQKNQHQNQKIQFQICTDEERIKQVMQQATRLNHALSVVRGVPTTRAHISFGGYYDGL